MKRQKIIENIVVALLGCMMAYVIFAIVQPVYVSGESMEPTFHNGDILRSKKVKYNDELMRGDIVIFNRGNKDYIKRIVALPGDLIQITDGILYINNEKSIFQFEMIEDAGFIDEVYLLGENMYFCLGDNRNNSVDSRQLGPITQNEIIKIIDKNYGEQNSTKQ